MTTAQRLIMWRIMGAVVVHGVPVFPECARRISDYLWHVYREPSCDKILDYFISRGIMGPTFLTWVENECAGNIHTGIRKIIKHETGEKRRNFVWEKLKA